MGIDWEKTQPNPPLDDFSKSLVRGIAEHFLKTGTGVPDHAKRVDLGKGRHVLSSLVNRNFITNIGNKFYPAFAALYYLPTELRERCELATAWVLKAFQALYKVHGPQTFKIADVSDQIDRMASRPLGAQAAPLGMLFARDFPNYFSPNFEYSRDAPITLATAWDNILDFENLQQAWEEESARRNPIVLKNPASVPPTRQSEQSGEAEKSKGSTDKLRRVFVVHGRDEKLRSGVFTFLRSLGLEPLEWTTATQLTGKASPYIGEILDAAFAHAQAVVVLLSPDDLAKLREDLLLTDDPIYERTLAGQARPNVLFEAGMAFASHPNQTVLVQFGQVRPFSDVAGRHTVKMDNSVSKRQEFALKLRTAGCSINLDGTDWHSFGDLRPPNHKTEDSRSEAKNEAIRRIEAVARVSNIVSLKPLLTPRSVAVDDSDTWREVRPSEEGLLAALAIFRSEPIKGITLREIDGLTAQITFFEANGGEVLRVNHGTWLGDPFNHVSLAVGDTRELLIAVDHPRASPHAIENTRGQVAEYELEGSREKPLAREIYDVNVRLIGSAATQGDVVEEFHFNLDLRGEVPILKRGWTR